MWMEAVPTAAVLCATAAVFATSCVHVARAAFADDPSRAETRLALCWSLAFAAAVIGCLALTQGCGTLAAASFATLLCLASFAAGRPLARSWRLGEAAERERLARLRALVERYRENEDSIEQRCARAARAFDLTRREEELLGLLLEGKTRSEMARQLYVSNDTVKTHLRNLYRKTGVSGKAELLETLSEMPSPSRRTPA